VLHAPQLAAALNEARVQRLVTDDQLAETLRCHPKRRGARNLRALLAAERGPRITRSEAERRALALMRAHGIEPDETDFPIGPYRVDFLFRRERLIVEVDGYRYHGTRHRFVTDRRRSAALSAMGYQVHPLTWDDITVRPAAAMSELRLALVRRRVA
jgi:very-short-patch-repair endonuclease